MDKRVYKAAIRGDVTLLQELLQQDNKILDGATRDCISKENPLHVAVKFGHVDFVKEILSRKTEYARKLNWQGLSPLYLASEKGHVQVVKALLEKDADACLLRDSKGRTPLQIAAMKGRVEVLKELFLAESTAAWVSTDRGEPILHLCANHNQFEAVRALIELVKDDEFVNLKDSDDNTILHVLATKNQTKIIKFLLNNSKVEINALNVNKHTALDILVQAPRESNYMKLRRILRHAGARRAKEFSLAQTIPQKKSSWKAHGNWLNETKSTVMVVAILIATVTFQAVLNPPGGVWQDNYPPHTAGEAIMSYEKPEYYLLINFFNQIGFLASVSIILLLISGFNVQRRSLMWALMISMWIAIGSMVVSFGFAFNSLTKKRNCTYSAFKILRYLMIFVSVFGCLVLIGLLLIAHLVRLVIRFVKKFRIQQNRRMEGFMDRKVVAIQMPMDPSS